ncbi:diaminopimelate decarboxylase [Streptomyces sp. V4I8]
MPGISAGGHEKIRTGTDDQKRTGAHTYVTVDGGMSDNPRPTLYGPVRRPVRTPAGGPAQHRGRSPRPRPR